MTAHVVFTAVDASAPVTISAKAIQEVIRGYIGFEGLLMSDDLSMQALSGSTGERAAASLAAGCDLALHCNGNMKEMAADASAAAVLDGLPLARFERTLAGLREPEPFAAGQAEESRAEALAALA